MLLLVRHPKVLVAPGVCYGRLDAPLAPDADVEAIVWQVGEFTAAGTDVAAVWSSPLSRCATVGRAIAGSFGLALNFDSRLLELDFGEWEGRKWTDVPREALDQWAASPASFAPPSGENGQSLIHRAAAFKNDLDASTGSHIVVSHGGPLRLLSCMARGQHPDLLAPSPAIGSVHAFRRWRSREHARGGAEHGALARDFSGAEDVAAIAADLSASDRG